VPEYASEESRGNRIIIAAAMVIFVAVVWWGVRAAFPEPPKPPLTIYYDGVQLFPKP
jgi:hypothetical protein